MAVSSGTLSRGDQGPHGGKIILPPPALGVFSSSLSRDFMGRTPISTVVNAFYQQQIPVLSVLSLSVSPFLNHLLPECLPLESCRVGHDSIF